ncbi:hypothetical protein, partial [Candidatus Contendibacter odensensis]|uniref:hypothetical protein n=1 Tax=Candidatus Contendibacter odensensis TaxID=1400860 RepID=UPI001E2F3F7A
PYRRLPIHINKLEKTVRTIATPHFDLIQPMKANPLMVITKTVRSIANENAGQEHLSEHPSNDGFLHWPLQRFQL